MIVNKADDAKDTLQWKLQKGPVTAKTDYGDPLATTSWAFCVYDAAHTLTASAEIPAAGLCTGKPCWKETRSAFVYASKTGTPDGVRSLQLKEGLKNGKSSVLLKGKGTDSNLPPMPLPPGALPLVIQLQTATPGPCFETTLGTATRNTTGKVAIHD